MPSVPRMHQVRFTTQPELEPRLAPSATLVRDINPGNANSISDAITANAGGVLYFVANDGVSGSELWRSDGTSSGTTLVRDIVSGNVYYYFPRYLTNVGGLLYFSADDGSLSVDSYAHRELWRSDGTSSGTTLVYDITPHMLTNVNGVLYFVATDDDIHGWELWRSDGTSSGTTLVRDISPGIAGSYPVSLKNVGGVLYFGADGSGGSGGNELWRSDGTSSGTKLVREFDPGNYAIPKYLTNVGGLLYFRATDGVNGYELWRSDGTSSGTTLVHDIHPGNAGSNIFNLTNVGGQLFFAANDGVNGFELWRSDGTSSGTTLVHDIRPGISNSMTATVFLSHPISFGGLLYFGANNGVNGFELWRSDGTSSGTTLVHDIRPGPFGSIVNAGITLRMVNVGGLLYFGANDGVNGHEVWRSDGTSSGTILVDDIRPGQGNGRPEQLTEVNGQLYFRANDSIHGFELFSIPPAATVAGMTVNGGATQRSRITSITVTFTANTDVTLFQNPGAVTLTRTGGGSVTVGSGLIVTPGAGTANSITLTFQNASLSGVENGSLADGRWQLAIPGLNYTSTLNDPSLRRLFGDADANGTINAADFADFGNVFGSAGVAFDFDNNGTINAIDFAEFGNRFGVTI